MVKLNKIYTRTGDDGTTGLVRGPRRFKYDLRVACYGTVDEANSAIGICGGRTIGEAGNEEFSCARFPTLWMFVAKMTGLAALPVPRKRAIVVA